jgi:putative lumazine-binding protein
MIAGRQFSCRAVAWRRRISVFPFSVLRWLFALALLFNGVAIAQTASPDESAAIKKTALDYIEGWYAGDAARMERALHPDLAKRMISIDPKTGRSQFNHMGAMALIQHTRDGGGKKTPQDRQLKEVTILDRYNNTAVVKIVASDWIDYLEIAKFNGEWKIINVLWELKPKASGHT